MDLLLQLQQDVRDKINSESAFGKIWCGTFRAMVTAQEIEKRMPHLMGGPDGSVGCGILVMMPTERGLFPNVSPPQTDDQLTLWVVENPEMNFDAGGAMVECERVARMVRQCLHQFGIEGLLMLYQEDMAIVPIADIHRVYPGCCGYQVQLRGRMSEKVVPKCVLPALTDDDAGNVTLSTTDAGASIYYTMDGSFPGVGNARALLYAAPFQVAANGTVLRWASYLTGYYGSDCGQATVTIAPPVLSFIGFPTSTLNWTYGGPEPALWQRYVSADNVIWNPFTPPLPGSATSASSGGIIKWWRIQGTDEDGNAVTAMSNSVQS